MALKEGGAANPSFFSANTWGPAAHVLRSEQARANSKNTTRSRSANVFTINEP